MPTLQLKPFNFRSCSSHILISSFLRYFPTQNLEPYHVLTEILVRAISEVSDHSLVQLDPTSSTWWEDSGEPGKISQIDQIYGEESFKEVGWGLCELQSIDGGNGVYSVRWDVWC